MAIAFVQGTSNSIASPALSITFPSNNTAGNLLVLVFRVNAAATISSVLDTQGNTWILAPDGNISTTGEVYELWYALNCKAGPNIVTLTQVGGTGISGCIGEYSGIATSSALDGHATAAGLNSGNITTTATGDLLVGYAGNNTGSTITQGATYTLREQSNNVAAFEDKISGAAGTYSAIFAAGPSDTGIIAFKAAATPVPGNQGGVGSLGLGLGLGPMSKWEMF